MWNKPLFFKNMPENGRDVCDSFFFMGIVGTLITLGLLAALIHDGIGDDWFNLIFLLIPGYMSVTPFLSCYLLARGKKSGRLVAWFALLIFCLAPLKLYRSIKALYSQEMDDFLRGGSAMKDL